MSTKKVEPETIKPIALPAGFVGHLSEKKACGHIGECNCLNEDGVVGGGAPANSVGGGGVQGIGFGPKGEPGMPPQLMPMARRGKKIMGVEPYVVSSKVFHQIKEAKKKGKHWRTYLEEDDAYHHIREEARKKKKGPILVQDEKTGACTYVRYS
jgi:hypothetical protein